MSTSGFYIGISLLFGVPFLAFLYFLIDRWIQRRTYKLLNQLPGPPTLPLLGNAIHFSSGTRGYFKLAERFKSKYSSLYRGWLGTLPFLFVSEPDHIRVVFNECIDKPIPMRHILNPYLGDSILTSNGAKWKRHRRLIQQGLTPKILDSFMVTFVEIGLDLVDVLKDKIGQEQFDISPYVGRATLDAFGVTSLGVNLETQKNTGSTYVKYFLSQLEIMSSRILRAPLYPDVLFKLTPYARRQERNIKHLHSFTNHIIAKKHEQRVKDKLNPLPEVDKDLCGKNPYRKPFLDFLMDFSEDDPLFNDENLRNEVNLFLAAGYETSAKAISAVLLCLGCHPEIQEKVYQELYTIFGKSNRTVELTDLGNLVYLEMVIKEALRLFPPIPLSARTSTNDFTLDNYTIPAGVTVITNMFMVHRDPKYWPDPMTFNPDRFLPANVEVRNPYAYVPFAAGQRICIGVKYAMMSMKTFLATVLRHYKVSSNVNFNEIECVFDCSIQIIGGTPVRIERRKIPSKNASSCE